jgi:hypothetical protein
MFVTDEEADLASLSYREFLRTNEKRWLAWMWLKALVRGLPEDLAACVTLFSPMTPTPLVSTMSGR